MKQTKKYLGAALLAGFLLAAVACTSSSAEDGRRVRIPAPALNEPEALSAGSAALEFIQDAKIGWNLGNSFDAWTNGVSSETVWGNPRTTQALLNAVAAQGFGAVRIPITWMGHISAGPGYAVETAWLARVAEVVKYAHNAGLKVIINVHHDGADSAHWLSINKALANAAGRKGVEQKFEALWLQIAGYFKNHGDYLLFEGMNEIHDGTWGDGGPAHWAMVNEWNQIFVNAVRSTGGNNVARFLVIPGYVTRPNLTVAHLQLPEDSAQDRLVVTIHYYDPYEFAIAGTIHKWGEAVPAAERNPWGQEDQARYTFESVKERFVDEGIPVIIGEYGAVRQQGYDPYRKYYMEYVTKAARDAGMVPFYWDNGAADSGGENFGLFNRASAVVLPAPHDAAAIIAVMMKAVNETYSLSDVVLEP